VSVAATPCPRCESPLERGDLRCAICAQAVPRPTERRETVEVEVQRCEGCGAAVEYDVKARAPRCPFCGATTRVETIEDPMESAEGFLPFTVSDAEAKSALRRWLGTLGFFRPADLRSAARVDSLKPLYWVGWLFDADALVSWAADTNAGARRARWAPCAGQASLRFTELVVSASRGLSHEEVAAVAPGCRTATARPEPGGAQRPVIERFDVQRSQARAQVLAGLEAAAQQRIVGEHLPGKRHRKLEMAFLLRGLVTRRLAFPAWVMAYRYRGKPYRAVICGQDASLVVGSAPWSWLRIVGAVVGGLALAATIVGLATLASA
jgi:hypothetical protein